MQKGKKCRPTAKKNKKEKKRTCRDSRRKNQLPIEECAKKAVSKSRAHRHPGTAKESSTDVRCPACDDVYGDPPGEDWIQCDCCQRWWHETCSAYDGGMFHCDLCV